MKIYFYNPITFEYLYSEDATLDPAEWEINHQEVYLIPADATTAKPPKTAANQVAVYDVKNGGWNKEPDYRGLYAINETMHPALISVIGALPAGYIAITEAEALKLLEDELYYIFQNGQLIVNPNYEEDKKAKEEALFNAEFFNTSLGYVRRKVTMKDGTTRDFLADILALLQPGVQILTYTKDLKQRQVSVTEQFINECKQQMLVDFYGVQ